MMNIENIRIVIIDIDSLWIIAKSSISYAGDWTI